VAEAVHSLERRKLTPSRLGALFLPLACAWFYIPIFRVHGTQSFPPAFQARLSDIFGYFANRTTLEFESIAFAVVLFAAIGGRPWLSPAPRFVLSRPEWVAVLCYLLTPVLIIVRLAHGHGAFFNRYGDAAMLARRSSLPSCFAA